MLTLLKQGLLLFPCAALCPTASSHQNKRAPFSSDWMVGWCWLFIACCTISSCSLSHVTSISQRRPQLANSFRCCSRTDQTFLCSCALILCGCSNTHGFALPLELDTCTFMLSCGEIQLLRPGNIFGRDRCFSEVGLNPGRVQ